MESFARLLQMLMVWHVPECFVEVDARILGVPSQDSNINTEQQSTTTTTSEGHQTTPPDTLKRRICSWHVLCTGVESNRDEIVQESDEFIANLGGRRPPRRLRACNSTNSHELNNTLIEAR